MKTSNCVQTETFPDLRHIRLDSECDVLVSMVQELEQALSLAKLAQERGHYFSITPAIEYSTALRHIVQNVPLERLLLESDGPVGYRLDWGRILGTPSWLPIVARKVCQLKAGQRFEELLQAIEANIIEVFGMNS